MLPAAHPRFVLACAVDPFVALEDPMSRMTTVRDYLVSLAAVAIVVQVLAFGDAGRAIAQTFTEVIVKNTTSNPVPVRAVGTTAVNVNNAATAPVWSRVNNPASAPVWVRDVNEARQPYHAHFQFTINPESYGWSGVTALTVPNGKRFVLEYASFRMTVPQGQSSQDGPTIQVTNRGQSVEYHLPPATYSGSLLDSSYIYVSSNPVALYADPGTPVGVGASRSGLSGTAYVKVSLSGYLVNVP
jgi:hypothetical protein